MKNLILFFSVLTICFFASCKKEPLEPIVGVTPEIKINPNDVLFGTTWVLIQYRNTAYIGSTKTSDTITFISNTEYKLNNGSVRTYNLSPLTGSTNKSLQINFFTPFGGSNYSGSVGKYFITDGFINSCLFTDNQNSSIKFLAWFERKK
jgi:hypothetical protein